MTATLPSPPREITNRVRMLDFHPDLGVDLGPVELSHAARALVCPLVEIEVGTWNPARILSASGSRRPFASVIVEGLAAREVSLGGHVSISLYGPRDLVGAQELDGSSPPVTSTFRALTPLKVAVLDTQFLACVQRWPMLAARLTESAVEQIGHGCVRQAISQLRRADHRLVAVLWMLADRWGRVGSAGISLDLPLTHEALGLLIGASRPTVSLALRDLMEAGLVRPRAGRAGWLLAPSSLEVLQYPLAA